MNATRAKGTNEELHGPHLHAPVWPWLTAGWVVSALFVIWIVIARLGS
jgi:hypothetical protein